MSENVQEYSRNGPLYMTHRDHIAQNIVRSNKCTNRVWKIKSSFIYTILLGNLDILCPRLPFPSSFVRSERFSRDIAYNSQVCNSATCVIPAGGDLQINYVERYLLPLSFVLTYSLFDCWFHR